MPYDWDPAKAARNLRKHDVSFDDAQTVFDDPLHWIEPDPEHSFGEVRMKATGLADSGLLLVVVFVEDGEVTRIISARRVTRRERRTYVERR